MPTDTWGCAVAADPALNAATATNDASFFILCLWRMCRRAAQTPDGTSCNLRFKCIEKAPPKGRAFVANCNPSAAVRGSAKGLSERDKARRGRFYRPLPESPDRAGNV